MISHHLAHAYHTYYMSGFNECAVLVCDLAGSATIDGKDFSLPFTNWYTTMTSADTATALQSENLSIYKAKSGRLELLHRGFALPHVASDSMIQSPASLYENVSRFVFGGGDAYGQLMALAAFGANSEGLDPEDLVHIEQETEIRFKNDWQHGVSWVESPMRHARLAYSTQVATEKACITYAKLAKRLSGSESLAVAGGVFLNIPTNSRIADSGLFERYYVPSSPHDAGVAVGCSFSTASSSPKPKKTSAANSDRLGRSYGSSVIASALAKYGNFLQEVLLESQNASLAKLLLDGAIVARWNGRAEFGPRALGGRSLLASPCLLSSKERLNQIKGREQWRPVAPIVGETAFDQIFTGAKDSYYMSYTHRVREKLVDHLPALLHEDGTTRAQVLKSEWDLELSELLEQFGILSGVPVLVNTSFNGKGEPIVETPEDAILTFLRLAGIDYLILGTQIYCREKMWVPALLAQKIQLSESAELRVTLAGKVLCYSAHVGASTIRLTSESHEFLSRAVSAVKLGNVFEQMDLTPNEAWLKTLNILIGSRVLDCLPMA